MRKRIQRPSPALVISCLALFVALGGVGYAAAKINGKNIINKTVAGKKLKNKTVTGGKVKDNTLTRTQIDESKLDKVPSAAKADIATQADNASTVGGLGPQSFARTNGDAVSGTRIYGTLNISAGHDGAPPSPAGTLGTGAISFGARFESPPTYRYINPGDPLPTGCSGTLAAPVADPGFVCIFEGGASNASELSDNTPTRMGVTVFFTSTGAGDAFIAANWAATAP